MDSLAFGRVYINISVICTLEIRKEERLMKDPRVRNDAEGEGLITERDIDDKFGLFREGSFPDSLPDEDQIDAIRHALPKDKHAGTATP